MGRVGGGGRGAESGEQLREEGVQLLMLRGAEAAAGCEMLKRCLHIHHAAEDETVRPALAPLLAGRPGDLAPVAAMGPGTRPSARCSARSSG
jgi:hypothetical protein